MPYARTFQREEAEASIYVVGVVLPHERDKAVYGKLQAGEGPVKGIRTRAEADGATYPSEEAFAQSDVFRTKELHPTADVLPPHGHGGPPPSLLPGGEGADWQRYRAQVHPVSFSATVPLPPMVRRGVTNSKSEILLIVDFSPEAPSLVPPQKRHCDQV